MTFPNDWEIRKCLLLLAAIIVAFVGLAGLAAAGFDVPVLRQLIGFIYLTFIPGMLILRILRVHNLGTVKAVLYSVGLSIAFTMFSGLFINTLFPYLGISKPISSWPLTLTLVMFTVILFIVAYLRDRGFQPLRTIHDEREKPPLSPSLLLILLPILAILGALLVTFRQDNTLLLLLIPLLALVLVLVALSRFIPPRVYPLAIVMIALALLFHKTLLSVYLCGADIQVEYYYQNLILTNSHWDSSLSTNLSAMLSIMMLCPIYSLLLGIDSAWLLKIIYPLIFSMVPLALFEVYREQIDARKAFLATFFFMSMAVFFIDMTALARQQIAELFFVLLMLLMVDRRVTRPQKSVLAVIFAMSLPVSHYGLAYIAVAFFVLGWTLLLLLKNPKMSNWWQRLSQRPSPSSTNPNLAVSNSEVRSSLSVLSGTLVCLYVGFLLAWSIYTSSGSVFNTIVNIGNSIYFSMGEFLNPINRETLVGSALGLDFGQVSILGKAFRVIQYLTQAFIVVGFIKLLLKPREFKFRPEIIALTIVSALILLACILVPLFAAFLSVTRFYHITLILLAPFCILGYEALWGWFMRACKYISSWLKVRRVPFFPITNSPGQTFKSFSPAYLVLVLLVLIPYFLFNTGFMFEVTKHERIGEIPTSTALSNYRWDGYFYNWQEGAAREWLYNTVDEKATIYGDVYGGAFLLGKFSEQARALPPHSGQLSGGGYIFLRSWNIERNQALVATRVGVQTILGHTNLTDLLDSYGASSTRNKIYDNGDSQILVVK